MADDKEKFEPLGEPLPLADLIALTMVTPEDVQKAMAESPRDLKDYLEAE